MGHALFQRAALLWGRLVFEAADRAAMWGAANAEGRCAAELNARNAANRAFEKSAEEMDSTDALSLACLCAPSDVAIVAVGWDAAMDAAGFESPAEWLGVLMAAHPLMSKSSPIEKVTRVFSLLIDLLRSGDLPPVAVAAVWYSAQFCLRANPPSRLQH